MIFLTDFGDSAVLVPLSVVVFVWLLTTRSRGPALWWLAGFGVLSVAIAASKVLLFACPVIPDVRSPSGHTGFSLYAYGGLAVIVAAEVSRTWQRVAIILVAALIAAGIGFSRVVLHMHSAAEAVTGFAVGAAALAIFGFGYLRRSQRGRTLAPLLVGAALILAAFHGGRLNPEYSLRALSLSLHLRAMLCP